ncbi:MAG: ChbG/HpnK family deacetylase [Planctomycetota bacterium]
MEILFNADDYGLTRGITDRILETHDDGVLQGVSLIANGHAFDYAVAELARRPGLLLTVHLNLIEGRALAPAAEIPDLIDADGYLRHSFVSLWRMHSLLSRTEKASLGDQVEREMRAQIERIEDAAGKDVPLGFDGHQHTHMIPFVFERLSALLAERTPRYVRLPEEPWFVAAPIRHYVGLNPVKHMLLKRLSRRHRGGLAAPTCDAFVGVLHTGGMTVANVKAALAALKPGAGLVEVLLHPGGASPDESPLWEHQPWHRDYYFANGRARESAVLKGAGLRALLEAS